MSVEEIKINYKDLFVGDSLNIYYEFVKEFDWSFVENGSYFFDVKDNFNY